MKRPGGSSASKRAERFRPALPAPAARALRAVGAAARDSGVCVYLVGGFVRDTLLGRPSTDIDVAVEGDALRIAELLVERAGGAAQTHPRFRTAAWTAPDGTTIHLSATRTETYAGDAELPVVAAGSLDEDLFRRDFSVNALAVPLKPRGFGPVINPFGGVHDLRRGVLRILHARSFLDDPTRAYRAARFEAELGFDLASGTREHLRAAIGSGVFDLLSAARVRREIARAFEGTAPVAAARAYAAEGLLATIDPALRPSAEAWLRVRRLQRAIEWHRIAVPSEPVARWPLILAALAAPLSAAQRARLIRRLRPSRADSVLIVAAHRSAARTIRRLARHARPAPSRIYAACEGQPTEALLLSMAIATEPEVGNSVKRYLGRLRGIRTAINGRDLIEAGVPVGPEVARRLRAAHRARLDGRARTPQAELRAALRRRTRS